MQGSLVAFLCTSYEILVLFEVWMSAI